MNLSTDQVFDLNPNNLQKFNPVGTTPNYEDLNWLSKVHPLNDLFFYKQSEDYVDEVIAAYDSIVSSSTDAKIVQKIQLLMDAASRKAAFDENYDG